MLVTYEANLLPAFMLTEVGSSRTSSSYSLSLFALILVGQPELRATLRLRAFEPLCQRVGVRHHLEGFDEQETKAYVGHILEQAWVFRSLFSDSAIAQIYSISRDIPRVINNLCTDCLLDMIAQRRATG